MAAIVITSGCASFNYNRGFKSGMEDYKRVKSGKQLGAWKAGWASGFIFMKTSYDLERSLNALKDSLEQLRRVPLERYEDDIERTINEMLEKEKLQ